ncbi:MAG: HlyD family efflux transporter periplasmic adaptor subunit [Oscillospiraceae bacterium]|nr:HlyD family efflux transporter periplasmic adaptor subunit [Oscillospiraceae bacterium]
MEMQVKNRAWVKNAVIVFLAILLILTFFSNTIMNHSLAEVATQSVNGGSITARVRGTGTVKAEAAYEVKATQTKSIAAVKVKVGQEVNEGDVLFILGDGSSEELAEAQEALRQLELQRQRATAGYPSADYSLAERNIEQAREKLNAAYEAQVAAYEALVAHSTVPENVLREANAKIETMQKRVDEAKAALTSRQEEFVQRQVEAEQRVNDALAKLNELLDNPPQESEAPQTTETPEESAAPQESEEKSEYQRQLDDAKAALEAAQMAQAALDPTTDLELINAQENLEAAQTDLENAQKELDDLLNQSDGYAEAYAAATQARQEAEDELFILEYNLNQEKMSVGKSASSVYTEIQEIDYQIEKAKEKIESLSGGEGDQVLANAAGIIEEIYFTAGNTPAKGELLCTIQVPDLGYTLSFSVTNDQAMRLRTGDEATVSNYWWGREINAVLASIRTDPQNPQTNKLLTFDVSGDVNPGSELTLAVGSKSQNYDSVVPNSAIRSDANGSFLLVVEAKNSPLGNRYYAKRVDVTVLASDDLNSAVSGDLGYGDFVITTSNMPVKNGDMVRMAD